MSVTRTSPFGAVLQAAQEREADAAALREQKRQADRAASAQKLLEKQREDAKQRFINDVRQFADGFQYAVAAVAEKCQWSSEYIEKVRTYVEALLCQTDHDLPEISPQTINMIFSKFAIGLEKAARRGVRFPEGYFFGQRALAEWQAPQPVPQKKLYIAPAMHPKGSRVEPNGSATPKVTPASMPSAITRKGTRPGKRK